MVFTKMYECESESHSVTLDSLQPYRLCSPWNSLGQKSGMGSLSLLQGIFPIQSWTWAQPALQVDSSAEPQGKPRNTGVAYSFSSRSAQPRNRTRVSCIAGGFITNWAIRERQKCMDWWFVLVYLYAKLLLWNIKYPSVSLSFGSFETHVFW